MWEDLILREVVIVEIVVAYNDIRQVCLSMWRM